MNIFYSEVLTTGLIYLKKYLNQDQIELYKMDKYVDAVHDALKKKNIDLRSLYSNNVYKQDFFYKANKKDEIWYVSLKDDTNIERISSLTIGIMPWNVVVASQDDEALKIIGLEKQIDENGKVKLGLCTRENMVDDTKKLVKKMQKEI